MASFIASVISLGSTYCFPVGISSVHLLQYLTVLFFCICGYSHCIALIVSWLPRLFARVICSRIILMSRSVGLLKGIGVSRGMDHSIQKLSQVSCPPVIYQVSLNFAFFFFSHPGQLFITVITHLSGGST